MTINWQEEAVEDFRAIIEFIAADNPAAALEADRRIRASIEGLHANPYLGTRCPTSRSPTIVVSTGQRCAEAFCDRISELTCAK